MLGSRFKGHSSIPVQCLQTPYKLQCQKKLSVRAYYDAHKEKKKASVNAYYNAENTTAALKGLKFQARYGLAQPSTLVIVIGVHSTC